MLRIAVARSYAGVGQGLRSSVRPQWLPQRSQQLLARAFADEKPVDKVVVGGVVTGSVAGVPQGPILANTTTTPQIPPAAAPKTPPTPAEVGANSSTTSPPPKRPRRRFRNFLLSLIVLSTLGYAGGVYYSLVSDNFHDFFTEYVPFGEDAVAYFEEREFHKRFPPSMDDPATGTKSWPQMRGEEKITIGRSSGLQAKIAEEKENVGSDLGAKGRHSSAIQDNQPKQEDTKKPATASADQKGKKAEAKQVKDQAPKKSTAQTKQKQPQSEAKPSPSPAIANIDHINVNQAEEPVVQGLVKLVNNIITAVNASSEATKLAPTITAAKDELNKSIGDISSLKDKVSQEADAKIKDAHSEFDKAAQELVKRLEAEMQEQELKWREEYEEEREKLSQSYQQRLAAELDAAQRVAEQKNKNALVEQEIALQKKFMDSVKSQVEAEREGRLAKLDELSGSVTELEKLTGEWNSVVDATLETQHLQVALEAVRAKLQESEFPTPFLNELVALKEVSKNDDVVTAAIASIPPLAYQRGIPSVASLIDRFRRVATEVRKASLLPEDAGVASHAASAVLSRLMFQKKSERGLPEGDDVEATLARTEVLLEEGDLDAAAREMNALRGWAGVLSKDWVKECRRVLEVKQAVEVIATEARLKSLLVE